MLSPDFAPLPAALGGALIGVAASMVLLFEGRVSGISGLVDGMIGKWPADGTWRVAFLGGLVTMGVLAAVLDPARVAYTADRGLWVIAVGGLLVGFGTALGNGCTSGHGVCGLSRFSPRSLVSVLAFMGVGAVTATAIAWLT